MDQLTSLQMLHLQETSSPVFMFLVKLASINVFYSTGRHYFSTITVQYLPNSDQNLLEI